MASFYGCARVFNAVGNLYCELNERDLVQQAVGQRPHAARGLFHQRGSRNSRHQGGKAARKTCVSWLRAALASERRYALRTCGGEWARKYASLASRPYPRWRGQGCEAACGQGHQCGAIQTSLSNRAVLRVPAARRLFWAALEASVTRQLDLSLRAGRVARLLP